MEEQCKNVRDVSLMIRKDCSNSEENEKHEGKRNILNESQFGYDCNCAMHQLFFKSVSHTWENSN